MNSMTASVLETALNDDHGNSLADILRELQAIADAEEAASPGVRGQVGGVPLADILRELQAMADVEESAASGPGSLSAIKRPEIKRPEIKSVPLREVARTHYLSVEDVNELLSKLAIIQGNSNLPLDMRQAAKGHREAVRTMQNSLRAAQNTLNIAQDGLRAAQDSLRTAQDSVHSAQENLRTAKTRSDAVTAAYDLRLIDEQLREQDVHIAMLEQQLVMARIQKSELQQWDISRYLVPDPETRD